MKRIATIAAALASVSTVAAVQTPSPTRRPPDIPFGDEIHVASRASPPSVALILGKVTVVFEKTTLSDVSIAAGGGAISHDGDAAASEYWLCYTIPSKPVSSTLWVTSNGEMGGPSHEVTSVAIATTPGAESTPECPALPRTMLPVYLSNGLKLGDSVSVLNRVLGEPQRRKRGWREYTFEGKSKDFGVCDGGFDQANWLYVEAPAGAIRSLHAGQVTSC
jgi:hypothetical protein